MTKYMDIEHLDLLGFATIFIIGILFFLFKTNINISIENRKYWTVIRKACFPIGVLYVSK